MPKNITFVFEKVEVQSALNEKILIKPYVRFKHHGQFISEKVKAKIIARGAGACVYQFYQGNNLSEVQSVNYKIFRDYRLQVQIFDELTEALIAELELPYQSLCFENAYRDNNLLAVPRRAPYLNLKIYLQLLTYFAPTLSLDAVYGEQYAQERRILDRKYSSVKSCPPFNPSTVWILKALFNRYDICYVDLESQLMKGQITPYELVQGLQLEYLKYWASTSNKLYHHQEGMRKAWLDFEDKVQDVVRHTENDYVIFEFEIIAALIQETGHQAFFQPKLDFLRKTSFQIVLYYNIQRWETHSEMLYKEAEALAYCGIPNSLRSRLWLDFSRLVNIVYRTELALSQEQMASNRNIHAAEDLKRLLAAQERFRYTDTASIYFYHPTLFLYLQLKNCAKLLTSPAVDAALYDLCAYASQQALSFQEQIMLASVLRTFCAWSVIYTHQTIIYCKSQLPLLQKAYAFTKSQQVPNQHFEASVFWLFACITAQWLKRYYDLQELQALYAHQKQTNAPSFGGGGVFNQKPKQSPTASRALSPRQPGQEQPGGQPPLDPEAQKNVYERRRADAQATTDKVLFSNRYLAFSVKQDVVLLKQYLRDKLPEVFDLFFRLSFPTELVFTDHFLSGLSTLFSEELLFRVWDCLSFQSNSLSDMKVPQVMICACIEFLAQNSALLLDCKNLNELHLALQVAAQVQLNCDAFLAGVKKRFYAYFSVKRGSTFLDAIKTLSFKLIAVDPNSYLARYNRLLYDTGHAKIAAQNKAVRRFVHGLREQKLPPLRYAEMLKLILSYQKYCQQQLEIAKQVKATKLIHPKEQSKLLLIYLSQIKRVYLLIHSATVKTPSTKIQFQITYSNQEKLASSQLCSDLQIFEVFQYRQDTAVIEISLMEILSEFMVPLYQVLIDLTQYFPNILYKDAVAMHARTPRDQTLKEFQPDQHYLLYSIILSTQPDLEPTHLKASQKLQQRQQTAANRFQDLVQQQIRATEKVVADSSISMLFPPSAPAFRSEVSAWAQGKSALGAPLILENSVFISQLTQMKLLHYTTQEELVEFINHQFEEWKCMNFFSIIKNFQEELNFVDLITALIMSSETTYKQKIKLLVSFTLSLQRPAPTSDKSALIKTEQLQNLILNLCQRYGLLVPLTQIHVDALCCFAEFRNNEINTSLFTSNSDLTININDPFQKLISQHCHVYGTPVCQMQSQSCVNQTNEYFVQQRIQHEGSLDFEYRYNKSQLQQRFQMYISDANDFRFRSSSLVEDKRLTPPESQLRNLMATNNNAILLRDRDSAITKKQALGLLYDYPALSYYLATECQSLHSTEGQDPCNMLITMRKNNQVIAKIRVREKQDELEYQTHCLEHINEHYLEQGNVCEDWASAVRNKQEFDALREAQETQDSSAVVEVDIELIPFRFALLKMCQLLFYQITEEILRQVKECYIKKAKSPVVATFQALAQLDIAQLQFVSAVIN